ncbi:MAG: DMT family transporter [Akkermansiaceae bacterium]|jgi:drug/metabolite transporter (DMT)-like permease
MYRDHLKLQAIIILWGFTAVLGALIDLSAYGLVLYRTAIAAIFLIIWQQRKLLIPARQGFEFTLTGAIIGAHWITFFLAVKVANVSICMAGIATLALWTAILEPLMVRGRKFRPIDLAFGVVVAIGVATIYQSELQFSEGFLIALLSAFLAAVFSVINSFHIKKAHYLVITTYEMLGAAAFTGMFIFLYDPRTILKPTPLDWLWLLLLAIFCTVIAFSQYIALLKRLPVFTINFASNLEPVYGMLLAALILNDYQDLNTGFWIGATIIIASMCAYPLVRRKFVIR